MSFVHEDGEFPRLLDIVAREKGIATALIEKDYWVTHTLFALHETGLEIWFKGGTSLSKGFGLIERFSEDLDLMIQRGSASGLPAVANWTSTNKGPVRVRAAYFDALAAALEVPGVRVERDDGLVDRHARRADYLGYYPGQHLDELKSAMSPFIRLEVGRARVVPHVDRPLGSFVHSYLEEHGLFAEFDDNRAPSVRCAHPFVTLIEKLDAMSWRYAQDEMEADRFVRHYEDAAQIIRAVDRLPDAGMTMSSLVQDMLAEKDIRRLPTADEPALHLRERGKRAQIEEAYEEIAPMFWGARIPLDEACGEILDWLRCLG